MRLVELSYKIMRIGLSARLSRTMLILAVSALPLARSTAAPRLKPGKTIQADLATGQTRSYVVKLKPHQYLCVTVRQVVPNIAMNLYGPDCKNLLEAVTADVASGKPARILWIAGAGGKYRVSITIPRQNIGPGPYEIQVENPPEASQDDRKRIDAEKMFTQGRGEARRYAHDQSIQSYTRALNLYREIKDHEDEAYALTAIGNAHINMSQGEKALPAYQEALAIDRDLRDRRGEAHLLASIGNAYFFLSDYDRTIDYETKALAISIDAKDKRYEGDALHVLGNAYCARGRCDMALGYYQRSRAAFEQVGDRRGQARLLVEIGTAYLYTSSYQNAVESYEQALPMLRALKDRQGEAGTLNNLGAGYKFLAQFQKAIGYYQQALAISREIKDRAAEGENLNNLGECYARLGQFENAVASFEEGRNVASEVKDRSTEAMAIANLGSAYSDMHQYEKAISYLDQGLALEREIKARQLEGGTLGSLGEAYRGLGQYDRAAANFAQALAISREAKDLSSEAAELTGLMSTWQESGRARLAIFYGKQAVNTIQSMRSQIGGLDQDLQQSFLKGNEEPYHKLAELLIGQGRLGEAEQVLALLKDQEYFQYVRRDAGDGSALNRRADLASDEAEYEKRYREIGDRLMTIGAERGDLLSKRTLTPPESQRLTQLEQDLAVGNQAFEQFLDELTRHFSAKPELNARVVEQLREEEGMMEDLRQLPAGTVAIYTLVGEDKLHAILRTPDAQKAYEYAIKPEDLNRKIFAFREAMADPKSDPRPLARELYRILLEPLANDLEQAKAQTLMWSLDGALRYVPIAALFDGQNYLIERYRVSVMTLASNARLKEQPDSVWSLAGFGVTKRHDDIEPLPEVASELRGVQAILHGEIKLDEQFTESSMRATLLQHFPVVHIASHFRFLPGDQSKSFLLLGDGSHLSMAQLKTLPNVFSGVQLLTLSACNTGVGDGTEVEGFGTLAQRQGAKAVIATLWPVADASTSRLMREFYRIRESSPGVTKLEALRQAQLEMLHGQLPVESSGSTGSPRNAGNPYLHPFYWAPFFLMGNWL